MLWLAIIGAVWLAVWAVLHLREQSSWEAGAVDQTRVAPDVLAGGVLFWLILGFFWRTVSGDVYQPADGGDLVSFLFPTYRFAAQQLSQGVLPLWNPHLYGGAPFISDIQAGFLYPVNAVLFLLRPDFDYKTMQWLAIGHLYWAGLGVYVLLRVLRPGGRPVARHRGAFLGGLAFALSDALFIHLGNLNLIAVLSWLPWIFAALCWRWTGAACAGVYGRCLPWPRGPRAEQLLHRPALGVYALTCAVIPPRDPAGVIVPRWTPLATSWSWRCSPACSPRFPSCCRPWR
ncbi:MAG: hypothetical protein R2851_19175 [Caldilineaceae bacterium]